MERVQKAHGSRATAGSSRTAQRKNAYDSPHAGLASLIDNSPRMAAQRQRRDQLFGDAIQRVEDEEPLQGKFEAAQRVEEEEPIQGKSETASPIQRKDESARPNRTGLPDNLKSGIESLSGLSMDNVRVHYNSSQPAQLNAHAYAQGTDIHVASGQEQHLPHEAWHVVQQAQGRVRPTMQMKEGVPVNDDQGLEREADVMGGQAASVGLVQGKSIESDPIDSRPIPTQQDGVMQLFPPANVEDANAEIDALNNKIQKKGIEIKAIRRGYQNELRRKKRFHKEFGPKMKKILYLDQMFVNDFDALDLSRFEIESPGACTMDNDMIMEKLKELQKLRKWKSENSNFTRGFGYPTTESAYFQVPQTRIHTKFPFNPFASHLNGVEINTRTSEWTSEQYGDQDWMVRFESNVELTKKRKNSKAYRTPKRYEPVSEPKFNSEVYTGASTTIDKERLQGWKKEKRGKKAKIGHYRELDQNWPQQNSVLKMSAQQAVVSANHHRSLGLKTTLPYEWLHMFAFSMGGWDNDNPQDPRNFVAGTQNANFFHLNFEKAAKDLVFDHGLRVRVESEPIEPLAPEWKVYRKLRYTVSILEQSEPGYSYKAIEYKRKSITHEIDCLGEQPVHVSDPGVMKHHLLNQLGVITQEYQQAVDEVFPMIRNDNQEPAPMDVDETEPRTRDSLTEDQIKAILETPHRRFESMENQYSGGSSVQNIRRWFT